MNWINRPAPFNQLSPTQGNLTPQFPGQKFDLSIDQARQWNNNQWKVKGYTIQLAATATTPVNINISGTAKLLIGISFHAITQFNNDALAPQSINLLINNETLIQDMPFSLLDVKYMNGIYWPFERMLSGNDNIILEMVNPNGAQTIAAAFYYL